MLKKIILFSSAALILFNTYGCVALLAGAAGGVGTAGWLSGKLTEEVKASFDRSIKAANSAMSSLKLEVTKRTTTDTVAQLIGKYTDERTVWIDIHRVSDSVSKVEVRVGIKGDKEASRKIIDKIKRYL